MEMGNTQKQPKLESADIAQDQSYTQLSSKFIHRKDGIQAKIYGIVPGREAT